MPRIRVLPPGLVNRIAAGECVERPASVVKELVENALDAGARSVEVAIDEGGRDRIVVSDDGCGMGVEDLSLCIVSHATSKLTTDEDLFDIRTLGFRGEALPSIASVARLRIVSRPPDADVGHELCVEGGEVMGPTPIACPVGTTVEVRDLFFNVPARRKFLRTNQTESGQVTEQLARIALAAPHAAFALRSGGRLVHRLASAGDHRRRIADFYGADLADGLLAIERESDVMRLSGYIAPPALCRPSNKWEYVFVNGRYIRDRFVSHAVREAYRSLIQNEFPVAFLFLQLDPAALDVNVHPTKTEVRWRDSNYVHQFVLGALREKFLGTNLDRPYHQRQQQQDQYRDRVRDAMVQFFTTTPAPRATTAPSPAFYPAPTAIDGATHAVPAEPPAFAGSAAVAAPVAESPAPTESGSQRIASDAAAHSWAAATPRPALQVHNAFLVVEVEDGLLIVDQHALHERILYEELRARIAERPLESQRLLLPDLVSTAPDRLGVLELHAETLARLGIEMTAAGPGSVAVQAFPTLLERVDRVPFVRDLLDRLAEGGARLSTESLVHDLLDLMACKAAVKAGDPLNADEIAALLARRESAERSSHCPHGRPTTLLMTLRDLERQFKRR